MRMYIVFCQPFSNRIQQQFIDSQPIRFRQLNCKKLREKKVGKVFEHM